MSSEKITLSIDPTNTQAILIGASEFKYNEKLPPIPAVTKNVDKLGQLLADPNIMGIPKDNITVIHNALLSDMITLELIEIIPKASDTLIIYYVGHGLSCPKQKLFYLATQNTDNSDPEATGALAFSTMRNVVMNNAVSKNIIFIFDCCESGRAIDEFNRKGNKQVFIMTATSSTEDAEAPVGATYTAFTNELLHILEKGIDNNKETLTLWEMYENLKTQLLGKTFPKPRSVIFEGAHDLKIAYNRAYQPPTQKQNLAGRRSSIKNMGDIDSLWQEMEEEPNQWDWERDLPEINFNEAFQNFRDQLKQNLKHGLSPVFLLQKSNSMGGKLFLLKIKNLLKNKIRMSCPVEIHFNSKPSAFEILNSLAARVNIKHSNDQDWQNYATNIIEMMFKPLCRSSDVIFIELKNCHYLPSDVLEWFVNEFWSLVENRLSTLSKNYIRVICVITANKEIKPSSEKIIELPLYNWKVNEIQEWLERYSNLDNESDFEEIAKDIYDCSNDGVPKDVYDELQERLIQI